jgi:hypothetical protein
LGEIEFQQISLISIKIKPHEKRIRTFLCQKKYFCIQKIFSNFILKIMKIKFLKAMMAVVILASMSSCATLFGGPITAYQKTKPAPGKPERELRAGALILDIVLFWPAAIVDFSNGAIYKPKPTK